MHSQKQQEGKLPNKSNSLLKSMFLPRILSARRRGRSTIHATIAGIGLKRKKIECRPTLHADSQLMDQKKHNNCSKKLFILLKKLGCDKVNRVAHNS